MSTVQPPFVGVPETSPSPAGALTPTGSPQLFRARTLEALLPQIRAALGPDAIVLRRREGLSGGVGGFFQQRFVEVEAVAGQPGGFDAYDDTPAWPEDVSADGVRWLDEAPARPAPVVDRPALGAAVAASEPAVAAPAPSGAEAPAAPFLAAAAAGTPIDGAAFLRHLDEAVDRRTALAPGATHEAFEAEPVLRGLLARDEVAPPAAVPQADPQPLASEPSVAARGPVAAYARAGAAVAGPVAVVVEPGATAADLPTGDQVAAGGAPTAPVVEPWRPARALGRRTEVPAPPRAPADLEVAVPERSTVDADVAEYGLIARGLSPAVARSVVLEAAAHGQPLDSGHRIDRAVRAALARRIPQTPPRTGVRTMVVVGAPGAGRTSAVGAIVAAHARAGRRVLAVAMDAPDGGAALAATLVGTDAELLVATGGATAAAAIRVARPDLCVVDTPAVHPSDVAAVEALAAELRALGADEVHLALPGTDQTTAALGALDGLQVLAPDALLMTHRDRAEKPGGVVGAAIVRGLPIGYVTDGRAVALAEPARLARMVQP